MDDLVESLTVDFSVSDAHPCSSCDPSKPHPRFSSYKSKHFVANSQERRRRDLLGYQKEKRFEHLATVRKLDEENSKEEEAEENIQGAARTNLSFNKGFRDQLMLSEWLVDVPEKFAEEWVMVPCPEGRHVLVVASKGSTFCYTKSGYELRHFASNLPGGNKSNAKYETILDCIFHEPTLTFYILDVIVWQDVTFFDGEREFRYFWLQQKMEEHKELSVSSNKNKVRFVLLSQFQCTKECLDAAMQNQFDYKLDGLLFYCSKAHYSPGLTPLIGWLKPFMMTEVLNVNVPDSLKQDFIGTTAAAFRETFNADEQQKRHRNKKESLEKKDENDMDVSPIVD